MVRDLYAGDISDFYGERLGVGDRVRWSMVWSCGHSRCCDRVLAAKCERLFKFGHEQTGGGRSLTGAYAESCFFPAGTAIFRVPANVLDRVTPPANRAPAAVAAVLRNAGALEDNSLVAISDHADSDWLAR